MEPQENAIARSLGGRPANLTSEDLIIRARRVRSALARGKSRLEICQEQNLTLTQYQTAIKWISRRWKTNDQAFAELQIGEDERLNVIQDELEALLTNDAVEAADKFRALLAAQIAMNKIRFNVYEMGLRLGILKREASKIEETRNVNVRFGDEGAIAWFNNPKALGSVAPIDVTPASVQ